MLGLPVTIEQLADVSLVRATIRVPARFRWTAGQHVFLRFLGAPGLHALSSHPFTVANAPAPASALTDGAQDVDVVFRVRGGITRALQAMAHNGKVPTRVLLDGPYGGIPVSLRAFDRVYLLAGGSGASLFSASSAHTRRPVDCSSQARRSWSRS